MENATLFELQNADHLALLQSLKTCLILHDAKTKSILWANAAACNVLGFTVQELLPLKAPDMTRKAEKYRREIGLQWLEDAVKKGESIIEWCYRAKNGTEILSEAVATRVTLRDRDVVMVQFRDIAAEERIKQDLKRLETRLREFMHNLSEGIAVLTPDGDIKYLSESSSRLLGLSNENAVPVNFIALCHEASRKAFSAHLTQACKSTTIKMFRYRIRNMNGAVRWHDASCRYIEIEDELNGVLLHFRDITDSVEAQEIRYRNERKLEHLARYNAMGEMAMTIAHELSQPLASAQNFLEGGLLRLSQLQPPPAAVIWGMESTLKQVERASTVIKSVRDYVVKLEQVEELVDLHAIVHDVEYFISLKARASGVRFETHLANGPLSILCEKILIGQVILNFAFNAIEAMNGIPAGKRALIISTRTEGTRVVLKVSDNGPGIDTGNQQRVFGGFFTSKISGNGIGLSLCKNIIARHRGDVWVEAHAPHGASFCFSLPTAI